MIGVRPVKLDPTNPQIVYATAFNNAIHRSAPSLEGGDASFKPVFAIVGRGRFQDLAMFDLTVSDRPHADVCLQRHAVDWRRRGCTGSTTPTCRRASWSPDGGANLTNTSAWTGLTSVEAGDPASVELRHLRQPVLLRSGRGGAGRKAGHRRHRRRARRYSAKHDPLDRRRRKFFSVRPATPRIRARPQPRGRARDRRSTRGTRTLRSSDPTAASSATTARSRTSAAAARSCRHGRACGAVLSRSPTRLYFLNRGLQTLQFYNVVASTRARRCSG